MNWPERETLVLLGGIVLLLVVASVITAILKARPRDGAPSAAIANLDARVKAWWGMAAVFALAVITGGIASVVLFGLLSFVALREFITLAPTKPADHRALFWAFFVITPVQYVLVGVKWFGVFAIFIPVYAFLFIPLRCALAADRERFLERTATVQWALMVCVYCVSHAPALLMLEIPGFTGNARLLLFFVPAVQMSDVLSASALGAALWWATPFTPLQAAAPSLVITLMGFCGGLVMSAIKRDRGVKDYGSAIAGHGGVMDRIDSLSFAAPVFFHLVRFWYT